MAKEDLKNGNRKLDIKLLERLIKETTTARDRTGKYVVYYIPLDAKYTDVCQHIFAKYGVNMEKYQSSLNPGYPLLKITFDQINKLPDDAREFALAVNVEPNKLDKRLGQIMAEMKANAK